MAGGLEPKWQRLPFVCAAVQRKGLPFTYRIGSFYSLEAGPAMSRLNPLITKGGLFMFFDFPTGSLDSGDTEVRQENTWAMPRRLGW